ncbi:MAG: hypothetical protein ACR2KK_13865 [Acidimicrobiales bacterium]
MLAATATDRRNGAWPAPIDMVRFTAVDGRVEQWLGWDGRTASWQTWDDPRNYYAGDPRDVLDPGGLSDPGDSSDLQLTFDPPSTESVNDHGDEVDAVELGMVAALDL